MPWYGDREIFQFVHSEHQLEFTRATAIVGSGNETKKAKEAIIMDGESCERDCCVRGHHRIWDAAFGEELNCNRDAICHMHMCHGRGGGIHMPSTNELDG